MKTKILYLSKEQNDILTTLYAGFTAQYIREINQTPINGWFAFTAEIRRKTGIENLKNRNEVRQYLERYAAAISGPGPTQDQTYLMRHFTRKHPIEDTAKMLSLSIEEAEQQFLLGLKAAGIFATEVRARRAQCRLYLACFRPNGTPPNAQEMEILREMATGASFEALAKRWIDTTTEAVIRKARELCIRLGFDTTGRNAQRHLIREYVEFKHWNIQPPVLPPEIVTMDDPMF